MSLNAKKVKPAEGGFKQPPLDAGTYPCRVVQIIDLGVQPQRPHKGVPKPPMQHIRITYEFTDEFCVDEEGVEQLDKPRWLAETQPFHSLEADLATTTKRYRAIDPDDNFDGDFTLLVDSPCLVTVVNKNGKGDKADVVYNNIGAVTTMRKKDIDKCAPLVNESLVFLVDEPDKKAWDKLPNFIQDKIKASLEFEGSALDLALSGKKAPAKEEAPEEGGHNEPEEEEQQPQAEPVDVPAEDGDEKPW